MSDTHHSQPLDDVSIELATIVDKFSAVSYCRMKKEPPMQVSIEEPVSFKMYAKTDFPEARPDEKQKFPKSMDMSYIDEISKKCHSVINKDKKVPIFLQEFEKICNYPQLTVTHNQDISEKSAKATEEEMPSLKYSRESDEDDQEVPGCSPCSYSRSPKDKEDQLETVLQNSEASKDDGTQTKETSAAFRSLQSSDISDGSTENNYDEHSTLKKLIQSSQKISTKANVAENTSSNNNGSNSEGKKKKKKGIFKRMVSRRKNADIVEYSTLMKAQQSTQEIDENSQEISTKTNVTENTSSNDSGSNSDGKRKKKKGVFKRQFSNRKNE